MERRAVVEHERGLRRERRDQPVPHHPAAGREVEDAVAGADVAVQLMLLEVLDQRAAGAVDDALRHAGRAGRVQDVERMIERQRLEAGSIPIAPGRCRGSRSTACARQAGAAARRRRYGITTTCSTDGRAAANREHPAVRIVHLPGVEDSASAVTSRRGSICPNRSSTPWTPKSGEQDDQTAPTAALPSAAIDRLRHVGHVARDAIAGADAGAPQRRGERGDAGVQLGPARPRAAAPPRRGRQIAGVVVAAAQQVLGEVERWRRERSARPACDPGRSITRAPMSPRTPPNSHIAARIARVERARTLVERRVVADRRRPTPPPRRMNAVSLRARDAIGRRRPDGLVHVRISQSTRDRGDWRWRLREVAFGLEDA